RRHTRFSRDWSSDVCSSDLGAGAAKHLAGEGEALGDLDDLEAELGVDAEDREVGGQRDGRAGSGVGVDLDVAQVDAFPGGGIFRSEERRVGKECKSGGGTAS